MTDKRTAIARINSRGRSPHLSPRDTHFANVNARKAVWWLDIPRREVLDPSTSHVDLVLAERDGGLHHLRVPKEWLVENIEKLAVREDKDVISLELSVSDDNRFTDVRPRSGGLSFEAFVVR